MPSITLKDLAERLGVSVTTVSKALKNYPDIGQETKNQVQQLARELNYKPNVHAVTLRSKKSKTLGVIVPKIDHYFFAQVLNGIVQQATQRGYLVITLCSEDALETEKEQVSLLIDKKVDGILMALAHETLACEQEHIMDILANDIRLVLFDRISSAIPCSKVLIDDQKAAYQAVKHLLEKGAKHVLFLGGTTLPLNYRKRLTGYLKALHEFGLQENPNYIFHTEPHNMHQSYEITYQCLKKHPEIDAIFAATDILALGAVNAIKDFGKKIPQEIAVIGFSNWFVTQYLRPKLSTVAQPSTAMGQKAVDMLIDEIEKTDKHIPFENQVIQLPTELVLRDSTRNAPP